MKWPEHAIPALTVHNERDQARLGSVRPGLYSLHRRYHNNAQIQADELRLVEPRPALASVRDRRSQQPRSIGTLEDTDLFHSATYR